MKTKTVTFHAEYNYGALLQAYSLQRYLHENGIENEIIDIRSDRSIGRAPFFEHTVGIKAIVRNAVKLLCFLDVLRYRRKMREFTENQLMLTRPYASLDSIADDLYADCLICGSDQIWNTYTKIRKEFFLDFPAECRRIAYAPSFGVGYLDDYQESYIKNALSVFSALSAREVSGVEMLHGMGFEHVTQCVDPVLLHKEEYWRALAAEHNEKTPQGKYILVYSLHYDPSLQSLTDALIEKHKCKAYVLTANGFSRLARCKRIVGASPFEFLNLIMNAEYIVASSLHGVLFSVIFQKNFSAFAQPLTGGRITDLLASLGLKERLISPNRALLPDGDIDYAAVGERLSEAVEKSKKYLSEAICG